MLYLQVLLLRPVGPRWSLRKLEENPELISVRESEAKYTKSEVCQKKQYQEHMVLFRFHLRLQKLHCQATRDQKRVSHIDLVSSIALAQMKKNFLPRMWSHTQGSLRSRSEGIPLAKMHSEASLQSYWSSWAPYCTLIPNQFKASELALTTTLTLPFAWLEVAIYLDTICPA